jgi:RNA polymerase sigma factor (sigma-70 family)
VSTRHERVHAHKMIAQRKKGGMARIGRRHPKGETIDDRRGRDRMDPDLLGDLLDQHAAALELFARQWCDVPEDVVQDAFLKLAAKPAVPANPAAWLFRVVRNGAIDAGQAARRRKHYESAAASWAAPWFEADPDERPGAIDPEQAACELQALPIDEREVIVAHLWGGLTFEQIAGVAGSSASTAHRHYARGLLTLRERLGVSCR